MAKIIYTKSNDEAINKHVVQNRIYKWLFSGGAFDSSSIILLAGKYPEACVLRANKYIKGMGTIYLYEKNLELYYFIKTKILDNLTKKIKRSQYISLKGKNVRGAPNTRVQDLDFCSTWFAERYRATLNNKKSDDVITIIQDRLHLQKQNIDDNKWRCMIGTISTRNGIGKSHTIKCLNSLCYQLGWAINSVDSIKFGSNKGYGKGNKINEGGTIHGNGYTYYPYEHKILLTPLSQYINDFKDVRIKAFTYTDTQPMFTFAITYRRKK